VGTTVDTAYDLINERGSGAEYCLEEAVHPPTPSLLQDSGQEAASIMACFTLVRNNIFSSSLFKFSGRYFKLS